jgi:hypothetical protein
VHRDDLHRSGIGLQPAAALAGAAAVRVLHPLGQPAGQRGEPERLLDGGPVQRLGEVPQVGEPPLAALHAEQPALEAGGAAEPLDRGGEAGVGEAAGRVAQQRPDLLQRAVRVGVELRGGPAEQRGERGQAHPPGAVRLLERLQQPQPVPAAGVRNTLVAPDSTHGTPAALSASCTSSAWLCRRTRTATSPGATGRCPASPRSAARCRAAARRRQPRRRRPSAAPRRARGTRPCRAACSGPVEHPQAEGRGAHQPVLRVVRLHRPGQDAAGARAPRRRRGGAARAAARVAAPVRAERLVPPAPTASR